MPSNRRPRVPRHAVADLLNQEKTIQSITAGIPPATITRGF